MAGDLVLLKLGGSLITDKLSAFTPRREVLARLAIEISSAIEEQPGLRLVLGHGSGSFGHVPAARYNTRAGVHTAQEWSGFVEVWKEARALNQIVLEELLRAGLPAVALPPSAAVIAEDGRVAAWQLEPLHAALGAGLLPVINGDVIFDRQRGGTILSTEDLFYYLAQRENVRLILLAGQEEGVWEDFPACTRLLEEITPDGYAQVAGALGGSAAVDVTGGMLEKVTSMLALLRRRPGLQIAIFSGKSPGLVRQALLGRLPGTVLHV